MASPSNEVPTGGLPKNFIQPCLLLLLREQQSHGYELLEQLRRLGYANPEPGGLYRALRALERQGLVLSWWESSPEGPPRRTYDLTEVGAEWLELWAGAIRESKDLLEAFLDRFERVAQKIFTV